MYYDVSLYRFKSGAFDEIREVIIRTKLVSRIAVRDLCGEPEEAKKKILSDIIAAEYRTASGRVVRAYIVKYEPDVYISILSFKRLGEEFDEGALKTIYGARNKINVFLSRQNDEAVSVSRTYWKKLLSGLDYSSPIVEKTSGTAKPRQKELFVLGESLPYLINVVAKKENISLKALFTTVWGIIMCRMFDRKFVLIEDIHEKGRLRHYPIVAAALPDFKQMYRTVIGQIELADRYDNVDIETTAKLYKLPVRGVMPLAQNFADMTHDQFAVSDIREEVVYVYEHYPELFAPLCVNYHFGDDSLSVEYEYEENSFDGMDIGKLHETFCRLVTQVLTASGNTDIRVLKDKANRRANQLRQTASKCDILRDCSLFANYSIDDLCNIAAESKLVTAVGEELITDHYSEPGELYVLGLGKISMEALDNDSLIHPMMLLKRGDCFGIEAVLKAEESLCGYRAVGGVAELVAIPPNIVEKMISDNPALVTEMLRIQTKRLETFQRLWMKG
ncbi:MAG: hypothetical protein K6E95_08795 [Lachnospiraceae bacterium]|nr:hypothetical protein [Lachnospiraceae bacterium]